MVRRRHPEFRASSFRAIDYHCCLNLNSPVLHTAAFLGIANPPRFPSPENVTAAYVKKALDDIAPRMEQLKAAGLLDRGYIYAFDESHEGYADALRLLFGEAKRRWPEVTTLSVLNWVSEPTMFYCKRCIHLFMSMDPGLTVEPL